MLHLTSYLRHAEALQQAAAAQGLSAHMDLADFSLTLSQGTRTAVWAAQFVTSVGGRLAYADRLSSLVNGFAGWMPYARRRWDTAIDKLVFKQHALRHGVATPAGGMDSAQIGGPFIIKKARSSFGEGIRGPFVRHDPTSLEQRLQEGEYCERFITGRLAKAWYWGSQQHVYWGAVEFRKQPVVTGNGRSTFKALVEAQPNSRQGEHDWEMLGCLARYAGLGGVDGVPEPGQAVLVDFKYASRYEPLQRANRNVIEHALKAQAMAQQFIRAGEVFAASIGAPYLGQPSLFTLDAVVDGEGTVWFLEMNSSPMVQPDMYGVMVKER